ncbi:MAG TPA: acetylglutamate kinase [Terriglobales bacterium]|nr:acetylglutamate kinase [Terriglobales bacterium]
MRMVVKIGGAALDSAELLERCARALADVAREGHEVAVVHGGGAALTRMLAQLGKQSQFVDGLRVTDAETRDVALMVLAGGVNKKLVAALARAGQPALGLCGGDGMSFRVAKRKANGHDLGYVGDVCSTDMRWLHAIWANGGVPVISSLGLGPQGEYYNVNADQMAAACAVACQAHALVFLTDVPGVRGVDGSVMRWLDTQQIPALVNSSTVQGGMLPKLEACRMALTRGVGRVRILPASDVEFLPEFYHAKLEAGTEVTVP